MSLVGKPPANRPDPGSVVRHPARLLALRKTGLLDTGPEESFDRLTALAARLLDVPMVLITLVDEGRDFIKSHHGVPEELVTLAQLGGRTVSHFAISSTEPLVIEDARSRPDVAEVAAVRDFGVRAYAGVPLIDEDGHAIGAFCAVDFKPRTWSARDVDVLVELAWTTMREIKLRGALTEARELLAAREEMMAVVAHDLRTPLNVVTMYAQLLGREDLPEKSANMIERLRRTADGMGQLIKSLMDISQVEAGSLVLNRQPFDPATLLAEAVELQGLEAARVGVSLSIECEPALPPVAVDYERVMRVFDCLVCNALKFSRDGGSVTLGAALAETGVRFSVKDSGHGIEPEELQGLLDRFWKEKPHERRGVGFGLAIASGLIEAHGGTMDAYSVKGKGSEFGFTLPLSAAVQT